MFFYELFLGAIICFFAAFVYTFSLYYLKDKRYRPLFFSLLLIGMSGLLLIYTESHLSLVFLDIPILLGYLKNHEKDSVLLSILMIFVLTVETNFLTIIFVLKYLLFFLGYLFFHKKREMVLNVLIGVKTFFFTFVGFRYYTGDFPIMILTLLAIAVFLYFVTVWIVELLKLKNNDYSLEKLETEKSIFKITHEIKNPIAVCKGYLDMLDMNDQDKVNKYIPIVRSEINRTLTVMDDFMSLSNIALRQEVLDIYMLIEDVRDTMRQYLDVKEVQLMIPEFDDELYIMGDYDRLKQVFINLIKNSYEAHANKISLTASVRHEQLKIIMKDNGEGIDAKSLKRIGEVFYTTKSKGTGIGVSLSKEIISLHNGEIHYASKLGDGTTVTIFLPIEKRIN